MEMEEEWFQDEFVQEILREIDKAVIVAGSAVKSLVTEQTYSATKLSGGSKLLISVYENPDETFLLTMGDNCTDFLERITEKYDKQGKDIWFVSNYLHQFKFNYTKAIRYVNWDIVCHSWDEIDREVYGKWLDQEAYFRKKMHEQLKEEGNKEE